MKLFFIRPLNIKYQRRSGLSLVELLIAMALLGTMSILFFKFLIQGSSTSASMSQRFSEAAEIQMVLSDIQNDLHQGASISRNSYNSRLEYTTYNNSTGLASKKIYRITTINGLNYLQLSLDNGITWISPYRVSPYTTYILKGSPKFLYSWSINNCTNFADSNADGIWVSGTDAAGVYLSCTNGTSSPALTYPSQATKVIFQGFQFSTGKGSPEATRTLATNIFLTVKTPYVRSTSSMTSPAVKDPPLVQSFITNNTNTTFNANFVVTAATWDAARDRLILGGHNSSSSNPTLYLTDRRGIIINTGFTTPTANIDDIAVTSTVDSILALDATAKYLYQFNISTSSSLSAASTLNMASPSNLINSPTGITYDPATPNDFYIVGADPADSKYKIFERNISTGALVGSAWALPAAFDSSHPSGGMAIEPVNGDFIVVRDYVNGTAPNNTIDIYIISRAAGTSTSFSVNVTDLGSSATGTAGSWGLGYDPATNRIFLTDSSGTSDKVYEVIPSQLISPRS